MSRRPPLDNLPSNSIGFDLVVYIDSNNNRHHFSFLLPGRQIDGIPPTFEAKPSIRQASDGRVLYFECIISAQPKPTVTWYHNGNLVELKGRLSAQLESQAKAQTYKSIMKIDDVCVEDAGKYKVVAKNELGESNASISLNFDGKLSLFSAFHLHG